MTRIALVIAMSLMAPLQQPQLVATNYLLSRGRAGQLEIGESVDDVFKAIGRENVRLVDTFREGLFSPSLEIRLPSAPVAPSIVAEIREVPCPRFAIWEIEVDDPRFRTAQGLGIGSRVGLLRRAYTVEVSHEEGEKVIVRALNMVFVTNADASDDRSAVTAVILAPDPAAVRARQCPGR